MKTLLSLSLGAAALSSSAFAQNADRVQPAPEPIFAGTYHVATGTFERAAPGQTEGVGSTTIYNNTAQSGFFLNISDDSTVWDEGRIPSTTSPVPGAQDTYTIDTIGIAYCTRRADVMSGGTGASVEISVYERKGSGLCSFPDDANVPLASLTATGLPGSAADGTLACFVIDLDLTGAEFCMHGDGNGVFDGDFSDLFSFSYRLLDEDFGSAGPLVCGDPANDPANTGLDTQDAWVELQADGTRQCLFFGGYDPVDNNPPFSSFFMRIDSPVDGECVGCGVSDDRFDPNDVCADAAPLDFGIWPNLYIEEGMTSTDDEDYFSIVIPDGEALRVDLLFDGAVSDLDLLLYDEAACGTIVATGFSTDSNETIRYPNCSGQDATFIVRVNHFSGPCIQYDLSLALDPLGATDDFLEENDECGAAVPLPFGETTGLIARPICGTTGAEDSDYYSVTIQDGDTFDAEILFDDFQADLDLFLYSDNTCTTVVASGTSISDNELVSWTNTTGGPVDGILLVDHFSGGSAGYSMRVCVTEGIGLGAELCTGVANSTGVGADLQVQGSDVAADNSVELVVRNLPQFSNGFFVTSQDSNVVMNPGGSVGNICIASLSIGRYDTQVQNSGISGVVCLPIDLTQTPLQPGGPVMIMAGDTFGWQYWYRDEVGGQAVSNFSSAVQLTFQ